MKGGAWEQTKEYKVRIRSRITPMEAAFMLDIPNVIMTTPQGEPAPFSDEARGYMESFYPLSRVLWGCDGIRTRKGSDVAFVRELAHTYPNLHGAVSGDAETLAAARCELAEAQHPLSLWAMAEYGALPGDEVLRAVDGIVLYTEGFLRAEDMQASLATLSYVQKEKKLIPAISLYDRKRCLVVDTKEFARCCEQALEWLQTGRIHGIAFCSNAVMGTRQPAEYWLREWVERVKHIELPE